MDEIALIVMEMLLLLLLIKGGLCVADQVISACGEDCG